MTDRIPDQLEMFEREQEWRERFYESMRERKKREKEAELEYERMRDDEIERKREEKCDR